MTIRPPTGADVDDAAIAETLRRLADALDDDEISVEAVDVGKRVAGYDGLIEQAFTVEYHPLTIRAADLLDDAISLVEIN